MLILNCLEYEIQTTPVNLQLYAVVRRECTIDRLMHNLDCPLLPISKYLRDKSKLPM